MHIDHVTGRDAFVSELTLLLDIAGGLSDHDLLAASRCRGWTVADVLTHVHLGLQEMLLGDRVPHRVHTDGRCGHLLGRSLRPAMTTTPRGTDHVRYVRVLSSAYQQPSGGIRHLSATGSAVMRAALRDCPGTNLDFPRGSGD